MEHFAVSCSTAADVASTGSELQQIQRALGNLDNKLNGVHDSAMAESTIKIASITENAFSTIEERLSN
jgi:hypothetical protein